MKKTYVLPLLVGTAALSMASENVFARCTDVGRGALVSAVAAAKAAGGATGGYGLPMWATIVDETGLVCHIATSGTAG